MRNAHDIITGIGSSTNSTDGPVILLQIQIEVTRIGMVLSFRTVAHDLNAKHKPRREVLTAQGVCVAESHRPGHLTKNITMALIAPF